MALSTGSYISESTVTIDKPQKNRYKRSGFKVDIEGFDELVAQVNSIGEDIVFRLSEPSVRCANIILNKARQKVPVKTGRLQDGLIVREPGWKKGKRYKIFATVGFSATSMGTGKGYGVMHGVPLELGHKIVRNGNTIGAVSERPYLRPASDESRREIQKIMEEELNILLLEYTGR